jgi:hypothetical protein
MTKKNDRTHIQYGGKSIQNYIEGISNCLQIALQSILSKVECLGRVVFFSISTVFINIVF